MEISVNKLEKLTSTLTDSATEMGLKLLAALIIYLVGSFLIKIIVKRIPRAKGFQKMDITAQRYIITFTKAVLYVTLLVSLVATLGVPMSSVIAVIASCGVAIGMAMQGALSNFAGGLMLLIFRPFNVGDYISSGGEEGTVKAISLVYTILETVDNRTISIPNGNLMNSNIRNDTCEKRRRVDLSFNISAETDAEEVRKAVMKAVDACDKIIQDPQPQIVPTAAVPGGYTYAVRLWVETADYWPVHSEMMAKIPESFAASGIKAAASMVIVSN